MWRQYSRQSSWLFKIILRIKTKSSILFNLNKRRAFFKFYIFNGSHKFSFDFREIKRTPDNAQNCIVDWYLLTLKNFDGSMSKPLWRIRLYFGMCTEVRDGCFISVKILILFVKLFLIDWLFVGSYKEYCLRHSKTIKNVLIRLTLS